MRLRTIAFAAGPVLGAVALAGCLSTGGVAPPVTAAMIGSAPGADATSLGEGRRIFTGVCANCHAPDPIDRHSLAEWKVAVNKMTPRAKLDDQEKTSLLAYITAAKLASPPAPR